MLRKAVDVLQMVSSRSEATTRDIAEAFGYSKSAAHRLMAALLEVGLLERRASEDGFILGRLIADLAGGPIATQRLRQVAHPHLTALRDACGETVALHCIQGDRRLLLEQVESRQEHRWVYSNPLIPMPLHAGAASKMLLAILPENRAEQLVKRELVVFTRATPINSKNLLKELEQIRRQRFAISFEEVTPGIASIAIPLFDEEPQSAPLSVVSVTGPDVRLTEISLKRLLPALRRTASRIASMAEETPRRRRAATG